jgi:hypothetical protein
MSAAGESGLRIVISQHVRERQRIAALDAEVDALQRQAVALGAVTPPTFRRGFTRGEDRRRRERAVSLCRVPPEKALRRSAVLISARAPDQSAGVRSFKEQRYPAYGYSYPTYGYGYGGVYRPALYGGYRVARRVAIHRARWH